GLAGSLRLVTVARSPLRSAWGYALRNAWIWSAGTKPMGVIVPSLRKMRTDSAAPGKTLVIWVNERSSSTSSYPSAAYWPTTSSPSSSSSSPSSPSASSSSASSSSSPSASSPSASSASSPSSSPPSSSPASSPPPSSSPAASSSPPSSSSSPAIRISSSSPNP